jgi:hypothetical protein
VRPDPHRCSSARGLEVLPPEARGARSDDPRVRPRLRRGRRDVRHHAQRRETSSDRVHHVP